MYGLNGVNGVKGLFNNKLDPLKLEDFSKYINKKGEP